MNNRTMKRLNTLFTLGTLVFAVGLLGAEVEGQAAPVVSGSAANAAPPSKLAGVIADTTWEWGDTSERIRFGKNGLIDHPRWKHRGLVTGWRVIDEHTVLLTIEEGRTVDRYAILVFNTDFTEYTGYDFHGGKTFPSCKRVQESARNARSTGVSDSSQPVRSGSRTGRGWPVSTGEMHELPYPWVVFGRVTDSEGKGMSGVTVSASCGWGTLMPTASTNSDAQGDYRMTFGPGRAWFDEAGRVDVAKTIEGTGLQAAIIGASKTGYYEKDLGRQGDLRMARELPRPDQHPGIAAESIVLPNQPRRVDFVMLPAASISGRVVEANGKAASGRRFYILSDKLPPAATVLCEFRPDETGRFKIVGVPCGSYWLEPADGSLAGVRSNPVAIPRAGSYDVEVSVNEAAKKLSTRIVTAPAPSTGD